MTRPSKPRHIPCRTLDEVPEASQLATLATFAQHLVLGLPTGGPDGGLAGRRQVQQRLQAELPDWTVFDSGGGALTVLRVVSRAEVQDHAPALVDAARQFRTLATSLATALATQLVADPARLLEACLDDPEGPLEPLREGSPGPGWGYALHGSDVTFRRQKQVVDVRLAFAPEFGVLDPYFFARFVKTTPGLERLGELFPHDFHDPARALTLLGEAGQLCRVERPDGLGGWLAP